MIAGADGFGKKWYVVMEEGVRRPRQSFEVVDSLQDLVDDRRLKTIVIDVPIGLTERGPRECDKEARAALVPRHNSVFPAPIRPMLKVGSYSEACRISAKAQNKRCSQQSYAIIPAIRQVDEVMTPWLQRRIREGHPEVSFMALTGAPMRHSKRDPRGFAARIAALAPLFPDLKNEIEDFEGTKGLFDLIDAHALLWTARRVRDGEAERYPGRPTKDRRGLRMEIVY